MIERTYPLGMTKAVEVLSRDVIARHAGKPCKPYEVLFVVDRKREAHILVGCGWHPDTKPGNRGIITCTAGGPKGQYWAFTPEKKHS